MHEIKQVKDVLKNNTKFNFILKVHSRVFSCRDFIINLFSLTAEGSYHCKVENYKTLQGGLDGLRWASPFLI